MTGRRPAVPALLALCPVLAPALLLLAFAAPAQSQDKPADPSKADKAVKKEDKRYKATVVDGKGRKTVLTDVTVRAGQSLFGSGSGKTEVEVKKGGGALKIKVPFEKIARIEITGADNPDYVVVKIVGHNKKTLEGHVVPNLELLGKTDFGEGTIRLRDAREITIEVMS